MLRINKAKSFKQIFFYHPDYTVGKGISPFREEKTFFTNFCLYLSQKTSIHSNKIKAFFFFADFTAGMELHHSPKKIYYL